MLKIGHRGAKGHAPENTIASFQKAFDLGCHAIEFDVQLCQSGEVVVIHDYTINRTTTATGFVKNIPFVELQQYNIPTLEQVLDFVDNRFMVNIELKSNDCVEKVIKIVHFYISTKKWTSDNFLISSFNWPDLMVVSASMPKIKTAVLTEKSFANALHFAKKINAFAVHAHHALITPQAIYQAHQSDIKICAFTVNDPEIIMQLKQLSIDGIISDFPDRI